MTDRHYFGTDGVRGEANQPPVTPALVQRLAFAASEYFRRGEHRHRVIIAKDTRLSGYMLEPALTSGFVGSGYDVLMVGPMPTPALAMLTRSMRADLGVMISASHNPYQDNGIKLFGPDGFKLSDNCEIALEKLMQKGESFLSPSKKMGRAKRLEDAPGRYIEFVKSCLPRAMTFEGLKIVVDCANGSAYRVAPEVIWELGAEVIKLAIEPNGRNINEGCGSTHPDFVRNAVLAEKADLGIAFDGDADRVIICDEKGRIIDGDRIIALIARDWKKRDRLKGRAVVATIMSNLGLERFLNSMDIGLLRTNVGDRYIVEKMRIEGCNLGGEPSGHIIMSDYVHTGDGLLAALHILSIMNALQKPMSDMAGIFTPVPQYSGTVRLRNATNPLEDKKVQKIITNSERRLNDEGRLIVRKSGTEPVIRVMAEGENETLLADIVAEIEKAVFDAA